MAQAGNDDQEYRVQVVYRTPWALAAASKDDPEHQTTDPRDIWSSKGMQVVYQSLWLFVELQRRIQAIEVRCYRKILHISYKDHVTKEEVRAKIQ